MIVYRISMVLFFVFQVFVALACNSKEHHSVLSHYNHAQKVFEGKVLRMGKIQQKNFSFLHTESNTRSIFIKFKITQAYKNCTVEEELVVGLLPSLYVDMKVGAHYIIYANAETGYDFLLCEKGFNIEEASEIEQQQFLFEIPKQHSGKIVEYSKFGRKWAEGQLENGLPVGEWRYYAESGELQIKGAYQAGEETGVWLYYYHTPDENYRIFQEIEQGLYFKNTGTYQVLSIDSNLTSTFKLELRYLVGRDTLLEQYYYNTELLLKQVSYENGWRHGEERTYDEGGTCISSYLFEQGLLEGAFFVLQRKNDSRATYLRVEGAYKSDEKYNERHLFYEKEQLIQTRIILQEGKMLF